MPRFLVERDVPRAHKIMPVSLRQLAERSREHTGDGVRWIHSYVLRDRIVCLFDAPDEQTLRRYAVSADFPAEVVREITTVLGPEYADDTPPAQSA